MAKQGSQENTLGYSLCHTPHVALPNDSNVDRGIALSSIYIENFSHFPIFNKEKYDDICSKAIPEAKISMRTSSAMLGWQIVDYNDAFYYMN